MRSYKCIHFDIGELVPPEALAVMGERAWELMDPRLLVSLDIIREVLGIPLYVNSWQVNGPFRYRGFRPKDCTEGAPLSQHRCGRAVDFSSPNMDALKMRLRVIEMNRIIPFVTCVEDKTPTWVHIDCRAASWESIRLINP